MAISLREIIGMTYQQLCGDSRALKVRIKHTYQHAEDASGGSTSVLGFQGEPQYRAAPGSSWWLPETEGIEGQYRKRGERGDWAFRHHWL
jgi:hypothetical protein